MEQDRYQQSHTLFITGLVALIACIGLIGFTLYCAPPFLWGWNYQIPQFLWDWQAWLSTEHGWTESGAAWLIIGIFFGLGILTGLIAWFASKRIDDAIYHVSQDSAEAKNDSLAREDAREAHSLEIKLLVLIIVVIIGAVILQWFFSSTA